MNEFKSLKDGTITHCNVPSIWKDCTEHSDCYYVECDICNYKSETDCKE